MSQHCLILNNDEMALIIGAITSRNKVNIDIIQRLNAAPEDQVDVVTLCEELQKEVEIAKGLLAKFRMSIGAHEDVDYENDD